MAECRRSYGLRSKKKARLVEEENEIEEEEDEEVEGAEAKDYEDVEAPPPLPPRMKKLSCRRKNADPPSSPARRLTRMCKGRR